MNLQQLEYIVAVDRYRHFVTAAEKSYITQATLSMMIKKLEEELAIQIFDRRKQPVEPTPAGKEIIERAHRILFEVRSMEDYAREINHGMTGTLSIGIIPTLAPHLLPKLIPPFLKELPDVQLQIHELRTADMIQQLAKGELDLGIAATPLAQEALVEYPLFYEPFYAYLGKNAKSDPKKYFDQKLLLDKQLWLLEDGHCMRTQVLDICSRRNKRSHIPMIQYESGSIETLIQLVDEQGGLTIVPALAVERLTKTQKTHLREFAPPTPVREVSLISNKHFARKGLLKAVQQIIQKKIELPPKKRQQVLPIV
jgi:LysR family hydrogen peroxide-inducible transcriptional activator